MCSPNAFLVGKAMRAEGKKTMYTYTNHITFRSRPGPGIVITRHVFCIRIILLGTVSTFFPFRFIATKRHEIRKYSKTRVYGVLLYPR